MINPVILKYTPHDAAKLEYQRFPSDYFAGTDIHIFLGDAWVDEVSAFQFALVEKVIPIRGYGSYIYDKVAKGDRDIQGSFRINFKSANYLGMLLNEAESAAAAQNKPPTTIGDQALSQATFPNMASHLAALDPRSEDYQKATELLRQSIWGEPQAQASERQNAQKTDTFFVPEKTHPNLHKKGFTITIQHGVAAHTNDGRVKELIGVHLTGVGVVVDGSGQPIQEEYTFIAQDLVWDRK